MEETRYGNPRNLNIGDILETTENYPEDVQNINGWLLDEKLGSGGNAVVWKAHRLGSSDYVALKILDTKKVQSERYRRFVQEVETQRTLSTNSGILPLLESNLPEIPSQENPAWLTTEIAIPLSKALAEANLDLVVEAVGTIAANLASLLKSFGIVHRDLKPDNLYELSGQWLVGDFGLVVTPDTRGLTIPGHKLGPAHFSPYELIDGGVDADMPPVDVYMLAKTLWVLATGNRYPPPGNQPSISTGFQISDFIAHPHAKHLDRLIDSMTALLPSDRPSMENVANELEAWLNLPMEESRANDSAQQKILKMKLSPREAENTRIEKYGVDGAITFQQLAGAFDDVVRRLIELDPKTAEERSRDKVTEGRLNPIRGLGVPQALKTVHQCIFVHPLQRIMTPAIRCSYVYQLVEDGTVFIAMFVLVGNEGVFDIRHFWVSDPIKASAGSIEAQLAILATIDLLQRELDVAIPVFVDSIPQSGGALN